MFFFYQTTKRKFTNFAADKALLVHERWFGFEVLNLSV